MTANEINRWFLSKGKFQTLFGEVQLSVHFGISQGEIEWGICKGYKNRKLYYFKGSAIDQVYEEIDELDFTKLDIRNISQKNDIEENKILKVVNEFENPDILKYFRSSEMRDVVSVFIQFENINKHKEISELFELLDKDLIEYGGILNKLFFGDKGLTALIFFGAPVAIENSEGNALDFILRFQKDFDQKFNNSKMRAGITRGLVYVGLTGGEKRNEWTALGDSVNTSARLMTSARWNHISVQEKIVNKTDNFQFNFQGLVNLKGKKGKMPVYYLDEKIQIKEIDLKTAFINREKEQHWLKNISSPLKKNKFAGINLVIGESGLGKTRLIEEFQKQTNFNWIKLVCKGFTKKSFYPVSLWLKTFFDINGQNDQEKIINTINQLSKKNIVTDELKDELLRSTSFLASLVDVYWKDSLWEKIEPKLRLENQIQSFKTLIKVLSLQEPLVVYIDDVQFIDEYTAKWLSQLTVNIEDYPIMILISSWPGYLENEEWFKKIKIDNKLELKGLSDEKIYYAIVNRICGGNPSNKLVNFLKDKGHDLPLFCEQLTLHLKSLGQLQLNDDGFWDLIGEYEKVPENISDLLVARLDRLDTQLKEAIKYASIIGNQFDETVFENLIFNNDDFKNSNQDFLFKAYQEGLIEPLEKENTKYWVFRSPMLREMAYKLQPPSKRIEIHSQAGFTIEELYKENLDTYYDDLIYHYRNAENIEREIKYLPLTIERFKTRYENQKAINYNKRIIELHDDFKDKVTKKDLLNSYKSLGYLYGIIGYYEKGIQNYQNALKISINNNKYDMIVDLNIAIADLKFRMEDFQGSIVEYSKIISKHKTNKYMDEINNALAENYRSIGEFDLAYKYYKESLKCIDPSNSLLLAMIYGNIGNLNIQKMNLNEAEKYLIKSLEICEEIDNLRLKTNIINSLAVIYANRNNYIKSEEFFLKQLILTQKTGNAIEQAVTLNNLGYLNASCLNNYLKALEYYNKALEVYKELDNDQGKLTIIINILEILINDKKYDCLSRYIDELSKINLEKLKPDKEITNTLKTLNDVISKSGEKQKIIFKLSNKLMEMSKYLSEKGGEDEV
ncbi:MAG: tetratricopeptide repeat protein [bacterium]